MTDDSAAPLYLDEIDTDDADKLGAGNPNVAGREPGADPVDHEALMGEVDEGVDGVTTDAAAATVEDDGEEDKGGPA